ncbi:MAG: acetyl-CoA carboxylase carboxyltransferase subunit alpha [bacterium]
MYNGFLDFETPLIEIEKMIEGEKDEKKKRKLKRSLALEKKKIYSSLKPYQIVQIARHPKRPNIMDYIDGLFDEFIELCGDRVFGNDQAIIGGIGRIGENKVMLIGHRKGRELKENLVYNFGMASPEGYRKAKRIMELGGRFRKPIITFIDTPGAYPGIEAEERGQAMAIAENLYTFFKLPSPIISIVIGEGGSGGALGIGVSDRILMLKYSMYSVASPEACASILWKDAEEVYKASENLHLTADALYKLGLIDGIIDEPLEGSHKDPQKTIKNVKNAIISSLKELSSYSSEILLEERAKKYRKIGFFKRLD